jgi:serine/threonine-protein kinase
MLDPGTSVGRYVVQRKLAEGGMAEIYLASAVGPEGFSKDVVIKVVRRFLATDPQFVQMFIAEARLASRLNHANVVQIFDFGKHEETYYLAMEYVRGASLWDLRKRCREFGVPFPPMLAAEVGAQVARGLQYAHSLSDAGQKLGVVHRDVTPHNVLLSFDGAVKLTDFGIAKAQTTQTAPGMLKGKFAYMSPEQARGEKVDARTDVFALGIVLWELLTGGRLFDGDSDVAVLRAVQESYIAPPARLNTDVTQDLSDIVMKALARKPAERFQSAFELEKALATWVLRNAASVEDTSVSTFLQQMFREEAEPQPVPAPPAADAGEDFGAGNTMFVDRAKAADRRMMPTLTSTPAPVRVPGRATPANDGRGGGTEVKPGLPGPLSRAPVETVPMAPPARAGTEQQPAFKPGPISMRFNPLPTLEPSVVEPVKAEPGTHSARTDSASLSTTEPAVTAESPVPAKSKGPFIVLGLALLGVACGVIGMALTGGQPPRKTTPTSPEDVRLHHEPMADAGPQLDAGRVDAGPQLDAGSVDAGDDLQPDAGPPADAGTVTAPAPAPVDAGAHAPPPVRYGTLEVRAVPFASVLVNGKSLGEVTGKKSFPLQARAYDVELVRPQVRKKLKVVIKPNETTLVEFDEQ